MSTRPASRLSAVARTSTIRSDAGRRRSPNPADALERMSGRLDELIRDVRLGARSHHEHDRHVGEAEAIGAGIRVVFREPAQPSNPPLAQKGGRAWW